MTLRPARLAAVGIATALSVGALVGVASSPASAAPAGVQYNCTVVGQTLPVFVQPTGALPSDLTSGEAVAAGSEAFPTNFTIPRAVLDGLSGFGVTQVGLSTSDFGLGLGSVSIPVTGLSVPKTAAPATGDLVLAAAGQNGAFTAPGPGTYDVKMPASFSATVSTDSPALASLPAACAIADPSTATLGTSTVTGDPIVKQDSTTTAKAPAKAKKGKAVKITVTVTSTTPATGTVTAVEGSKTLGTATLSSGKATITVKALKPGTHHVVVNYGGDEFTNASKSKTLTVKVTKK